MTIEHTVDFRLRHPAGSAEEVAFLATARSTLMAIPGVEDFRIDRQVSPKSELAWRFSMRFADQVAYDAYNDHPQHTGFVQDRWVPEVEAFQESDYIAY